MNPPKIATLTFTTDEARVLLQLIDAAVKSLGLNAAENAVVLAKKINGAFLEGPPVTVGACVVEGAQSNVV